MKNQTCFLCPTAAWRLPSSFILLILGLLLWAMPEQAKAQLKVGDPRTSWYTSQGTIEEATISVKPLGAYYEIGLYLTFSARGTQWYNKADSLEITYNFELPAEAIVHDSWLWIGDDIIKAKILDRWTAGQIYEGYVKRRTDPSILYKHSATRYELRVFPMAGNQKRRVKLSYLVPADWKINQSSVKLPVSLLTMSRYVSKVTVLAWANESGVKPFLNAGTLQSYKPEFPNLYQENYSSAWPSTDLTIYYETPMPKGYHVSVLHEDDGEGFYQVAFLPNSIVNNVPKRKVVVLLDYDANGGLGSPQQLLDNVQNTLVQNLTSNDSFNVIFSNLTIRRAAETWLPGDRATIESVFKSAQNQLATYTNLTPLLLDGFKFVKQQGGGAQMLLVSNASHVSTISTGNTLFNDLAPQIPPGMPIYVVDYYAKTLVYQVHNGIYYYGNSYFLGILASKSKGSYINTWGSNLSAALNKVFTNLTPIINVFDFHTTLSDGFCYGRFHTTGEHEVAYLDRPVVQIGKFKGNLPFKIQVFGEFEGRIFDGEIEVPENEIQKADSLLRESWYGNYIGLLEAGLQNQTTINEILNNSLKERVLSRYTAFLCPDDTSLICPTCQDETKLTGLDPDVLLDSTLSAFPNPFRESVQIRIKNTGGAAQKASLEIMNLEGRLVQAFDLSLSGNETTVRWDGKNGTGQSAPAGIYIAVLKTARQARVLKLLKQP